MPRRQSGGWFLAWLLDLLTSAAVDAKVAELADGRLGDDTRPSLRGVTKLVVCGSKGINRGLFEILCRTRFYL